MNWKAVPVYPVVFAVYAVMLVYSRNVGEVFAWEMWIALGASVLGVGIVLALIAAITRRAHLAGLITLILAAAFFSYGHVYNLLPGQGLFVMALYAWLLAGSLGVVIWQRGAQWIERAAPAINLITAALLIMSLIPVIGYWWRGVTAPSEADAESVEDAPKVLDSEQRPDIYYIILDAYSSNEHFLRDYGYDNSAFTEALEARGFLVAYESKTNYGLTLNSLAASLNMRYLTEEDDAAAAASGGSDEDYLRAMIADSAVSRELEARGYTYVYMLSGYALPSQRAEMNIDFHPTGPVYFPGGSEGGTHDATRLYQRPFIPLFLSTTMLRGFADQAQAARDVSDEPYLFWEPERALMTWDEAEKIAALPEATFAFVHIIKPHEPVAFDREGNIVQPYPNYEEEPREDIQPRFFEQVEFTNARTLAMIDAIVEQSDVPPIIILQGDHGSDLGQPESADGKRTNFEILNAYAMGGRECEGLTDDIVPVNSFRVVLNCVFGAGYPLLEAHHYAMPGEYDDVFYFEEVRPHPPTPSP